MYITAGSGSSWYIDCNRRNQLFVEEGPMFPDTEMTADGRFLEFNGGDWCMMVGGFTLAGLLVWLI